MNEKEFPFELRPYLFPGETPYGELVYRCPRCPGEIGIGNFLMTCDRCGGVYQIDYYRYDPLARRSATELRYLFDCRRMLNAASPMARTYRFYELNAHTFNLAWLVSRGEGNTPLIMAGDRLEESMGMPFLFKMESTNPTSSIHDRGMAMALTYAYAKHNWQRDSKQVVCYVTRSDGVAVSAIHYALLNAPTTKPVFVHPRHSFQSLDPIIAGYTGIAVAEINGKEKDCQAIVDYLLHGRNGVLLDTHNPWYVFGMETFAYELAQDWDWQTENLALVLPLVNLPILAGILNGFQRLRRFGIIGRLPKVIAVRPSKFDEPESWRWVNTSYCSYNEQDEQMCFIIPVSDYEMEHWTTQAYQAGQPISIYGGAAMAGLRDSLLNGRVSDREVAVLCEPVSFQSETELDDEIVFPHAPDLPLPKNHQVVCTPTFDKAPCCQQGYQEDIRSVGDTILKKLRLPKK